MNLLRVKMAAMGIVEASVEVISGLLSPDFPTGGSWYGTTVKFAQILLVFFLVLFCNVFFLLCYIRSDDAMPWRRMRRGKKKRGQVVGWFSYSGPAVACPSLPTFF